MFLARSIQEFREARSTLGGTLGLVPTMGALHAGHLSLAERARRDNQACALTIFVNPIQFGPSEDFATYPRYLEQDLQRCASAGVHLVFAPSMEEMYPPGFQSWVTVENLSRRWEGERRPGHFRGVATVVAKLLNVTQPNRAYFGEKDYQQLQVIHALVRDLNIPVEVVGCPTVREENGLAMSSRNVFLSPEQRQRAEIIYRALRRGQELVRSGERQVARLEEALRQVLAQEPELRLDYVAVVDAKTLEPLSQLNGIGRVLVAAYLGSVRLIDNAAIGPG
ncbi:MAG: pantoate--beta-alanine ligase [Deinococcus sp.]|nr:pantoate--beta-alanine ligase [Deinococcus sp.]